MKQPEAVNYENVDLQVKADIEDFHLALRPETIGQLTLFGISLIPEKKEEDKEEVQEVEKEEKVVEDNYELMRLADEYKKGKVKQSKILDWIDNLKTKDVVNTRKKIMVDVSVRTVGLVLLNEVQEVVKMEVKNITSEIEMFEWGITIVSGVQKIFIMNMLTKNEENRYILNYTQEESLVLAKLRINNASKKMKIFANVNRLDMVVALNVVKEILKTFKNETFVKAMEQSQKYQNKQPEQVKEVKKERTEGIISFVGKTWREMKPVTMTMKCEIAGPSIRIPIMDHPTNCIQMSLGNLHVNSDSKTKEKIKYGDEVYCPIMEIMKVEVDSISLFTNIDNHVSYIIKDVIVGANLITPKMPDFFTDEMKEYMYTTIEANVTNIETSISYNQLKTMLEFVSVIQTELNNNKKQTKETSTEIKKEECKEVNKEREHQEEWPPIAKLKKKNVNES